MCVSVTANIHKTRLHSRFSSQNAVSFSPKTAMTNWLKNWPPDRTTPSEKRKRDNSESSTTDDVTKKQRTIDEEIRTKSLAKKKTASPHSPSSLSGELASTHASIPSTKRLVSCNVRGFPLSPLSKSPENYVDESTAEIDRSKF